MLLNIPKKYFPALGFLSCFQFFQLVHNVVINIFFFFFFLPNAVFEFQSLSEDKCNYWFIGYDILL